MIDYFPMDHFSLTHCKMCLSVASKNSVSGPFICLSPYEVFPTLSSRFNVQGLFVSVSFLIGLDYAKLRLKVFLCFSWWFYTCVLYLYYSWRVLVSLFSVSLFVCLFFSITLNRADFLTCWEPYRTLWYKATCCKWLVKMPEKCSVKKWEGRLWISWYGVSGPRRLLWSGSRPEFRVKANRYTLKVKCEPQFALFEP